VKSFIFDFGLNIAENADLVGPFRQRIALLRRLGVGFAAESLGHGRSGLAARPFPAIGFINEVVSNHLA
jgi:hypothetical protein